MDNIQLLPFRLKRLTSFPQCARDRDLRSLAAVVKAPRVDGLDQFRRAVGMNLLRAPEAAPRDVQHRRGCVLRYRGLSWLLIRRGQTRQICRVIARPSLAHVRHPRGNAGPLALRQVPPVEVVREDEADMPPRGTARARRGAPGALSGRGAGQRQAGPAAAVLRPARAERRLLHPAEAPYRVGMTDDRKPVPPISDDEEARVQAMIAADPDDGDLTDGQLAQARPLRRSAAGRPPSAGPKVG